MRLARRPILLLLLPLALTGTAAEAAGQTANLQPNSGRDCAVCHLEWMESFKQPFAAPLLPRPETPLAAEAETCLGCHDGSVADSRRKVWLEHGHRTGVAPPAGMMVPDQLPLDNGKLACRTCHTAHATAAAESIADAIFLRIKNDAGQLCIACHADKAQGPGAGAHPLAKLEAPVPRRLIEAGAHAGADGRQLVCQTCHTAHGARLDHLLLMPTDSSQLCIACHEQMRPGSFRDDDGHEHAQNPALTEAAHLQAIRDMGTQVGAGNTLICLSCHRMHDGLAGRALLADTLVESQLCIRCHTDRQPMLGSPHDLRKSAPRELNQVGQTADESGPCSACHTFHSYARQPAPRPEDPQGLCTTCHAEDKVAAKHTGLPMSHPGKLDAARLPKDLRLTVYASNADPAKRDLACLTCHDPHETGHGRFLRADVDTLCTTCHTDQSAGIGGPHDFAGTDHRNARGQTAAGTGTCGFCHAVHNAAGPAMWIATPNAPNAADSFCAECHRRGGLADEHPVAAFNHPTGASAKPTTRPSGTSFPLFDEQAHRAADGFVACSTCHDLHASGKEQRHLLRASVPSALCIECHREQGLMAGSPHDVRRQRDEPWPGARQSDDLCTSCHRPHGNDPELQRWAVAPAEGVSESDALCISCHPESAWAEAAAPLKPGAMLHPRPIASDSLIHQREHQLPLAGSADAVLCSTCHDPHAAGNRPALLRGAVGAAPSEVCIACHAEAASIDRSMHAADLLAAEPGGERACGPCHAAHAIEGSERKHLWAAGRAPGATMAADAYCLVCHGPGGSAKRATVIQHPPAILKDLPAASGLAGMGGNLAAIDQISCSTCHLPHGRNVVAPETGHLPSPLAGPQISALKPMLRPSVARELCATCHGLDAARVYLYYHRPLKRNAAQRLIGQ